MVEEVGFEFDESSSLLNVRLMETVELGLSEPPPLPQIMNGYLQYLLPPNYTPTYVYAYAPAQIPR